MPDNLQDVQFQATHVKLTGSNISKQPTWYYD